MGQGIVLAPFALEYANESKKSSLQIARVAVGLVPSGRVRLWWTSARITGLASPSGKIQIGQFEVV